MVSESNQPRRLVVIKKPGHGWKGEALVCYMVMGNGKLLGYHYLDNPQNVDLFGWSAGVALGCRRKR